jgi:hypothetical protein
MLITLNGCDPVLRRYPRLDGADALGYLGPCGPSNAKNVEWVDVSDSVGRRHDWRRYDSADEVCGRWAHYTFLTP